MTKQEKIQTLKRAFERQRIIRVEGETDTQYVTRIVQEKVSFFRENFLKNQITSQLTFESQNLLNVSDL